MEAIETRRLVLRPFYETDCADLYEFLSQLKDDEFEPYPDISPESGREHLKERLGSEEYYAIELKASGKVIGNVYCGKRDFEAKEIGYIVNRDFRRKGFAAEALSAVIDRFFRDGVHRIYAECDPRNKPSWRLLEKIGLRREAHLKKNVFFFRDENGAPIWKDTYVYALTEDDMKDRSAGSEA